MINEGKKSRIIKEVIDEFVHATFGQEGWIPIYRVGPIENSTWGGYFFAFDLDYFDYSMTGYKRKDAVKYLLNTNAKIWDPVNELDLDVDTWSAIYGKKEDFEKYGIEDEYLFNDSEGAAMTSTDGLAYAGKQLGYQAVVIRDVGQTDRPFDRNGDNYFDEIAIFDLSIIKKVQDAEMDES